MDIDKEIAEIRQRRGNSNNIINALEEQKNQIDKQIHIISIISVACDVQDMIKLGDFSSFNIDKISLIFTYDHDYGNVIRYAFHDKDGHKIKKRIGDISNFTEKLDEVFDLVSGWDLEWVSDLFKEKELVILNLDQSFENKFIDLMLSKELKVVLEHGELQNSMPSNEVINKKIKM
jgi:hypothetical protein